MSVLPIGTTFPLLLPGNFVFVPGFADGCVSRSHRYFEGIRFIGKVKTGPFFEHSPILNDIATSVPSWEKVAGGASTSRILWALQLLAFRSHGGATALQLLALRSRVTHPLGPHSR